MSHLDRERTRSPKENQNLQGSSYFFKNKGQSYEQNKYKFPNHDSINANKSDSDDENRNSRNEKKKYSSTNMPSYSKSSHPSNFDRINQKSKINQTFQEIDPNVSNKQDTSNGDEPKKFNLKIIFKSEDSLKVPISPPPLIIKRLMNSYRMSDPRFGIIRNKEKLNLVLDLDETLLNSTINAECRNYFAASDLKELSGLIKPSWVILRPGVESFLEEMSKYYNIFAYSHGEFSYVEKLLEILDKGCRYFSRTKIFKNLGQVNSSTPKQLVKIENFTPEEIAKSIIIDDQKLIWEQEHQRVIPSKRFGPLRKLCPDVKKFSEYYLSKTDILRDGDSKTFLDENINQDRPSQLNSLQNLLKLIYEKYNLSKLNSSNASLQVDKIYNQCLKQLLVDYSIEIMIEDSVTKATVEMLANVLGARIIYIEDDRIQEKPTESRYIIIGKDLNEMHKKVIKRLNIDKVNFKVLSPSWIYECYFTFTIPMETHHELRL